MPIRQRKRSAPSEKGDGSVNSNDTSSASSNDHDEIVQEVMRDNLELMLEIVMRIREDPGFASNIYAECPRLQHLLDLNPDLRPIFEDPYLVRLNFEKVYRDAGGILPEDKPPKKSLLATIVSHPLFKVFRFLLIIKKLINCIMGGGMALLRGMFGGLCFDDLADLADTPDGDDNDHPHDSSPENQENREALNKAADHMEDPEVQGRMNEMLSYDDPERLEEAIDNDPELRALRDSNPLCRELMSDPETMRILVEPENLRALGDCPDMIEQDFSDPDWSPPDVENGASGDASGDAFHSGGLRTIGEGGVEGGDADIDADDAAEKEDGKDEGMELELGDEETGKEEGMELEMGDEDVHKEDGMEYEMGEDNGRDEGMEFELGDDDMDKDRPNSASKSKGAQKKSQDKKKGDGKSGFLHNIGVGITDMIAAELVGVAVSDVMGGDDEFAGLEDAADEAAEDVADDVAEEANNAAADAAAAAAVSAELLMNDDIAGGLEDGMDHVEDTNEEHKEDRELRQNAVVGAAAGGAVGVGFVAGNDSDHDIEAGDEEEEEEEGKKKSRFGFIGTFASAVSTAAKEMVAGELLGDDFGEQLVEKIEEDEEESEDDDGSKESAEDEQKQEKETKKKRGMFRKRRDGV
jgi:hypothetical protein